MNISFLYEHSTENRKYLRRHGHKAANNTL
jgi:hypothetical protein